MRNRKEMDRLERYDPFREMEEMRSRMFSGFGFGRGFGFHDDFDRMGMDNRISRRFDFGLDNFDRMFDGDFGGGRSNMVCHSYTTSTEIGPDGKPVTEKIVKTIRSKIGSDGQRIVDKNEMYNHSGNNVKRVVRERGLGDKQLKVTREVKDKQKFESRDLKNLEEEEVDEFNSKWRETAEREKLYPLSIGSQVDPKQKSRRMIRDK